VCANVRVQVNQSIECLQGGGLSAGSFCSLTLWHGNLRDPSSLRDYLSHLQLGAEQTEGIETHARSEPAAHEHDDTKREQQEACGAPIRGEDSHGTANERGHRDNGQPDASVHERSM